MKKMKVQKILQTNITASNYTTVFTNAIWYNENSAYGDSDGDLLGRTPGIKIKDGDYNIYLLLKDGKIQGVCGDYKREIAIIALVKNGIINFNELETTSNSTNPFFYVNDNFCFNKAGTDFKPKKAIWCDGIENINNSYAIRLCKQSVNSLCSVDNK